MLLSAKPGLGHTRAVVLVHSEAMQDAAISGSFNTSTSI